MVDRLTVAEASEFLHIAPSTLQFWRAERVGPPWYKLGKRVFYDRADLDSFIEASKAATR